jgi:hypothetical protein
VELKLRTKAQGSGAAIIEEKRRESRTKPQWALIFNDSEEEKMSLATGLTKDDCPDRRKTRIAS